MTTGTGFAIEPVWVSAMVFTALIRAIVKVRRDNPPSRANPPRTLRWSRASAVPAWAELANRSRGGAETWSAALLSLGLFGDTEATVIVRTDLLLVSWTDGPSIAALARAFGMRTGPSLEFGATFPLAGASVRRVELRRQLSAAVVLASLDDWIRGPLGAQSVSEAAGRMRSYLDARPLDPTLLALVDGLMGTSGAVVDTMGPDGLSDCANRWAANRRRVQALYLAS